MRDGEMVAAIVSGDPAALAATYDHYAPALYGYCRSLLSDPAEAADAVQDTFVVAVARLPGLRDPSRLRPWLYAVARNECHRRQHEGAPAPSTAQAPEPMAGPEAGDSTADLSAAIEQAELRELVCSALAGLGPGDQEIIELTLRHEFYGADLADALGVPRNQVHALSSRAQNRFEAALSALMMSRSGQESCPELAEILGGWDGELTSGMRRQVRRHLGSCRLCVEQRAHQAVDPTALLGMLPAAVLPAGLRYQVLGLTSDDSPDAVAYCTEVAWRAEPFSRSGFPVPLDPLATPRAPAAFIPAGVMVAVLAVFGGGAMLAVNMLHHSPPPASSTAAPAPSATAAPAIHIPSPGASPAAGRTKTHASQGATVQPTGTQGYLPGNGNSIATQPTTSGGHSATSSPTKSRHSTPPSTQHSTPPTTPVTTPPTTPITTPPTTPTSTPPASGTSSGSSTPGGLLGGIVGLLSSVA
jgi:RNA polymerase sigma factor (sigma-70 family)